MCKSQRYKGLQRGNNNIFYVGSSPSHKLCTPIYFAFIQRRGRQSEKRIRMWELTYNCMKSRPRTNPLTCCSYLCFSSSNCHENSLDCFSRSDFDLLRSASTFSIYMEKEREYLIFIFLKGIA